MVWGPTFLSLTASRQVSEKATTGPKSRGTSSGAMSRGAALNLNFMLI